jgi:hypothetical protein
MGSEGGGGGLARGGMGSGGRRVRGGAGSGGGLVRGGMGSGGGRLTCELTTSTRAATLFSISSIATSMGSMTISDSPNTRTRFFKYLGRRVRLQTRRGVSASRER